MNIPAVWTEPFDDYIEKNLMNEAAKRFRIQQLTGNVERWGEIRQELRAEIWKKLGVKYDASLDLDLRETGEIKMDGYSIKKVYYQSRPGLYVTGNLYIPEGEGPFPAVVGMHGHWSQGRLAERIQARGHSLAKDGYVNLQVDAWGAGERSTEHGEFEYHGAALGGALFNIGETLMGAQIVDNMRAVDVLCSLEYVIKDKIGATGASGGGNQTMWLAAMDERVVAAVPVVSVGTFQSYIMRSNCICECLPCGLNFTEESGILALIAPRALKICNCLGDSNPTFYPSEMLRSYKETRKVFKAYGADSKLSYQIYNEPHGYWPDIRETMLGWFDLHLRGTGMGAPKAEKAFDYLPEEDLMVFEKGKRPQEVISIAQYCRRVGEQLKSNVESAEINSAAKRSELVEVLKTTDALELRNTFRYDDNSGWETYSLETKCGRILPVLVRKARNDCKEYVIASTIEGKDSLKDSDYFDELWNSDKGIIAFDVYGSGETAKPEYSSGVINPYHTIARALLWLGKTLYGEWCKEFALLAEWTQNSFNVEKIEFFGYKELGTVAVLAGALYNGEVAAVSENGPQSFVFENKEVNGKLSMGFCIPDILKWGDLELAAKLVEGSVVYR